MEQEFDYSIVKNPLIFMQNRMDAHSDHVCYANEAEAKRENSSLRYSLNGLWKFAYAKNYALAVHGFEKTDYNCRVWDDIAVPAHIQMEGYGVPHYTNTTYPWEGREHIRPGEIPAEFNPVASYVKYFTIPSNMKGQRICISFQGVESGFAVWLNGAYVGYSENTFDPADFELKPYLVEGENKLSVRVFQWTAGSWCEDQDFYRFSGIFRDVFLYAIPQVHAQDVSIVPLLDETYTKGTVELGLKIFGQGTARVTMYEAHMYGAYESWNNVSQQELCSQTVSVQEGECKLAWNVDAPKLWSAEVPNLYLIQIQLLNDAQEVAETIVQLVGFRRFEMIDGLMCINGKRIVFKGTNRHEFSSIFGRVPNPEEIKQDIITMKQHNINAIRTSHYPDDSLLYHLCDVYGIYLIAENNLESHGSWEAGAKSFDPDYIVPNDNPDWMPMLLDRVNSCYQRDKNHASILIWSCGNESYGGKVIYEMSQLFRKLDAHRLVHYEGVYNDRRYNDTSDMESQMYPTVAMIENFLKEHKEKPFICCEYTHAMGNSCGAMHKYTDLTDREPRYQGGFIWDYSDQSIYKKNRYGEWFLAYGGDFMERPNDGNFSGNGIVYGGERKPSPKMQEVKYNYRNIAVSFKADNMRYLVCNKNLFVNTDIYQAYILLQENGELIMKKPVNIQVEPLSEKLFEIPKEIVSYIKNGMEEYTVTVSFVLKEDCLWAKAGHEVAFGQHVWKKEWKPYTCTEKPIVVKGYNNLGVKGTHFKAVFSKVGMGLVSYVYGGVEMLPTVPLPNFWRAPVDNDMGNMGPQKNAQWKIASLYVTTKSTSRFEDTSPVVEEKEHSITITYTYHMPTNPVSSCRVCYEVFGDGTIQTTMIYDPVEGLGNMPEFGMLFKLDADYDRIQWYGLGEEETYADRKEGAKLGIYKKLVADEMAGYLVPQECGNHCGVRCAKVTDRKGRGMLFFGDELSFSALPYTPHELENALHAYELPPVHYTVVKVSQAQMGVGGDDSWGAPVHPEYLLGTGERKVFTFAFRGII